MEKAIQCFDLNLKGKTALDVGASTGGFTDCMLQYGAAKVFAVDVGHGQLDRSLLEDSRVVNLEGTNIKDIKPEDLGLLPDLISIDVSFISLKKVLPYLLPFVSTKTDILCLLKPQFEIGRTNKGVVRQLQDHKKVLRDMLEWLGRQGFFVWGLDFSPVLGSEGNIEFLMYIKTLGPGIRADDLQVAENAHKKLKVRLGD